MEIPHKICTKCHRSQPLSDFNNEPKSPDGKTWYCKVCIKEYNAARAAKPKVVSEEKTCRKCGITKPIQDFGLDKNTKDGYASRCLLCKRDASATWRQDEENAQKARVATARWQANNPEKRQAYVEANKDKISQRRRERYAEDPAKENTQTAAYYARNKDFLRPKRQAWEASHVEERRAYHIELRLLQDPEERRARDRAWGAANPDKVREKNYRRKARRKNAPINDLSDAQAEEIKAAHKYRCVYCPPDYIPCKKKTHKLTLDHVTPYAHNGSHTLWNVVPACLSCNSRKHAGPLPNPVQPLLLTIAPAHKPKKKRNA